MFHLQTSVHLHEVEPIIGGIKDEFNGTSIHIADSFGSLDCGLPNMSADLLSNLRWCLFDDLLMAALDRAVALVKVYIVTMTVSEYLKLNVTWLLNISLNNNVLIIETLKGLSLSSIQLVMELLLMPHNSHTLATATEGCLDDNWEPDLFALL